MSSGRGDCASALAHVNANRFVAGKTAADACLASNLTSSSRSAVLVARAKAHSALGQPAQALDDATRAARLAESCWPLISLAGFAREAHRYSEALAALERSKERGGAVGPLGVISMPYHYHRGRTLNELGRKTEAIEELSLGLLAQPSYGYAYLLRAQVWASLGDAERATLDVAQALTVETNSGYDAESKAFIKNYVSTIDTAAGGKSTSMAELDDPSPTLWDGVEHFEDYVSSIKLQGLPTAAPVEAIVEVQFGIATKDRSVMERSVYSSVPLAPGIHYFLHFFASDKGFKRESGVVAGPVPLADGAGWRKDLAATGRLFSTSSGFETVAQLTEGAVERISCRPVRTVQAETVFKSLQGSATIISCEVVKGTDSAVPFSKVYLDRYQMYLPLWNGAVDGVSERHFVVTAVTVVNPTSR